MDEVGVETLRTSTRNATGEEATEIGGCTHDDYDTRNSSERITLDGRISFDGNTSQQFAVNLCKKRDVLRFGTWIVRTMDSPGKLELFIDKLDRLNLETLGVSETTWIGGFF